MNSLAKATLLLLFLAGCDGYTFNPEHEAMAESLCKDHGGVDSYHYGADSLTIECEDGYYPDLTQNN